jgi:hypothetical protein
VIARVGSLLVGGQLVQLEPALGFFFFFFWEGVMGVFFACFS